MVEVVDEFELGNYRSGGWLEPLQLSGNYKTTSGLGFNCCSREGVITAHDPVKPTNRLSD